jgi:hypothetical protein
VRKQLAPAVVSLAAGAVLLAAPTMAGQEPQSIAPPAPAAQGPQSVLPLQLADDDRPGMHFIVPWFLRQFLAPLHNPFLHRGGDDRRGLFYYLPGDNDDDDSRGHWPGWPGGWSDDDFFDD